MAFDPFSAAASAVGGIVGGIGAHSAAQAQEAAANRQARMGRSNFLMGMGLNEVPRSIGYQAYGDIASQFGYDLPAYQTQNQLAATMNPLSAKDVKGMIKQGMSVDQIAQMGTLSGLTPKSIKRLTKAGLSMEQIQGLATRQNPQQQAAPTGGNPVGNSFIESPDYQFVRDEGTRNIGNSFAARGGAASGNALRALAEFNSGHASGEFDKWFNRRMQLSGRGDQANQNIQGAGNTYTGTANNAFQAAGDARASGLLGVTGAIQGGLSGIAGSFGQTNSMFGPYSSGYKLPGITNHASVMRPEAYNNIMRNYLPGIGG